MTDEGKHTNEQIILAIVRGNLRRFIKHYYEGWITVEKIKHNRELTPEEEFEIDELAMNIIEALPKLITVKHVKDYIKGLQHERPKQSNSR
jgi:hypothetical protein